MRNSPVNEIYVENKTIRLKMYKTNLTLKKGSDADNNLYRIPE